MTDICVVGAGVGAAAATYVLDGPLRAAESEGLYCVGDWVVGEARLHAALRNGLETGERIAYAV